MRRIFIIILILFAFAQLLAQSDPYADTVIVFNKGTGSWINQNPPYFPDNVLGRPSEDASYTVPAVSPDEICSLGLGGSIVLRFTNNAIVNGSGADFTIFENAFQILFGPRAGEIFAEPGKVAVSKDGINFYEFPFDSLTLVGCAGLTPTIGSADPTNPDSSGGDHFDLSVVGLDTVYFVKITDVTDIILADTSNPYYDFTANGFDLDAVVAIHSADVISTVRQNNTKEKVENFKIVGYPNPIAKSSNQFLNINITNSLSNSVKINVFNLLGEMVFSKSLKVNNKSIYKTRIPVSDFPSGVYFIAVNNLYQLATTKFIIVK